MRKVVLDITKLNLSIGDTIKISLVDIVGNVVYNALFSEKEFVLGTQLFECTLPENKTFRQKTYYKLTAANNSFNFTVNERINAEPLDMFALLSLGCYENIISEDADGIKFDDAFLKKIDAHFNNEDAHFTRIEKNFITLYEYYYAQEIFQSGRTIDALELLDRYISSQGLQ